jgi:bifunctional polynucleotide phosphatase/kinase
MAWTSENSLMIYNSSKFPGAKRIIGFDLDSTIIKTKSGKKFPTNRNDWDWLYPQVPEVLKKMSLDGYKLVIFTNQAGIQKGKQKASDVQGKITDICQKVTVYNTHIFSF